MDIRAINSAYAVNGPNLKIHEARCEKENSDVETSRLVCHSR